MATFGLSMQGGVLASGLTGFGVSLDFEQESHFDTLAEMPGFSQKKIVKEIDGQLFALDHGCHVYNIPDENLSSCGDNEFGQLGLGDNVDRLAITIVDSSLWSSVACGDNHSLAINYVGELWSWGNNESGQLGLGNDTDKNSLHRVNVGSDRYSAVACGAYHTLVIKTDDTLWGCGNNNSGQLGLGNNTDTNSLTQVGSDTWLAIDGGYSHTAAIKLDGTLWTCGFNSNGQLGLGDLVGRNNFTQVGSDNTWSAVACGAYHTVAVKSDGTLWVCGKNDYGQLGLGHIISKNSLHQANAGNSTVACGAYHTLAIKLDGTLWTCGFNSNGQLGRFFPNDETRLLQQVGSDTWSAIAGGELHTLAIDSDGILWSCGNNESGELGNTSSGPQPSLTQVGSDTWFDVAGGFQHSLALGGVLIQGGVIVNGNVSISFEEFISGGVIGSRDLEFPVVDVIYNILPEGDQLHGGILAAGHARTVYNNTMEGGVVALGSAGSSSDLSIQGGVLASGVGLKESPVYHYQGSGTIYLSATAAVDFYAASTGDIKIPATDAHPTDPSFGKTVVKLGVRYNPTGGIELGGQFFVDNNFVSMLTLSWRMDGYIQDSLDLLWDTGQQRDYFYRVIGEGKPNVCPPIEAEPCCVKYVTNIHARSITDLCEKLRNRGLRWTIGSVERFSRPARNEDIALDHESGIDHECNELVPVDICNNPFCLDFCVDFNLSVVMGIASSVQHDSFFTYPLFPATTPAPLIISGFPVIDFNPNVAINNPFLLGGIKAGGEADVVSSNYLYISSGYQQCSTDLDFPDLLEEICPGISINGNALDATSAYWYGGGIWPLNTNMKFVSIPSGSLNSISYVRVAPEEEFSDGKSVIQFSSSAEWQFEDLAKSQDGQHAYVDLIQDNLSHFLVIKDFGFNVPDDATILGIEAAITREATSQIQDDSVHLVYGTDIRSDNLAKASSWPFVASTQVYGDGEELVWVSGKTPWRNESSPDYSNFGGWFPEDVNDPEFGVALRVKKTSTDSLIIAKLDNISCKIYYEVPNPVGHTPQHRLRSGGEANVVSSSYSYVPVVYRGSGFLPIGGSSFINGIGYNYTSDISEPILVGLILTDFAYVADAGYGDFDMCGGIVVGGAREHTIDISGGIALSGMATEGGHIREFPSGGILADGYSERWGTESFVSWWETVEGEGGLVASLSEKIFTIIYDAFSSAGVDNPKLYKEGSGAKASGVAEVTSRERKIPVGGVLVEGFTTPEEKIAESGPIIVATSTSPILITSPNHGLQTGDLIEASGAEGNESINGLFTITVVGPDQFQLDNSDGTTSGAYKRPKFAYYEVGSGGLKVVATYPDVVDFTPTTELLTGLPAYAGYRWHQRPEGWVNEYYWYTEWSGEVLLSDSKRFYIYGSALSDELDASFDVVVTGGGLLDLRTGGLVSGEADMVVLVLRDGLWQQYERFEEIPSGGVILSDGVYQNIIGDGGLEVDGDGIDFVSTGTWYKYHRLEEIVSEPMVVLGGEAEKYGTENGSSWREYQVIGGVYGSGQVDVPLTTNITMNGGCSIEGQISSDNPHSYSTLGFVWPQLKSAAVKSLTSFHPQVIDITYSFIKAGNKARDYQEGGSETTVELQDYVDTLGEVSHVTNQQFKDEIADSLNEWKELFETVFPNLVLNFINLGDETGTSVPSDNQYGSYDLPHEDNIGDFRFGMHNIDNVDPVVNTVAHGWSPFGLLGKVGNVGGDIHFDSSEDWRLDASSESTAFSVKFIAAHEIGHAFGVGHDSDTSALMNQVVYYSDTFSSEFASGLKNSIPEAFVISEIYGVGGPGLIYSPQISGGLVCTGDPVVNGKQTLPDPEGGVVLNNYADDFIAARGNIFNAKSISHTDLISHWKMNELSGVRIDSHGGFNLNSNGSPMGVQGKIENAVDLNTNIIDCSNIVPIIEVLRPNSTLHADGWTGRTAWGSSEPGDAPSFEDIDESVYSLNGTFVQSPSSTGGQNEPSDDSEEYFSVGINKPLLQEPIVSLRIRITQSAFQVSGGVSQREEILVKLLRSNGQPILDKEGNNVEFYDLLAFPSQYGGVPKVSDRQFFVNLDSSDLDGAILKFIKTSSVLASWNSPSNVHARIWAAEVEVAVGCPANYKLIRVTTLNPTGPGSLYEALTTPGERIVVFEVGGVIDLSAPYHPHNNPQSLNPTPEVVGSQINLGETKTRPGLPENVLLGNQSIHPRDDDNSKPIPGRLILAGETAPYPGITIIGGGLWFEGNSENNSSHTIVRHVRIRPGYHKSSSPEYQRALTFNADNAQILENLTVDHCTLGWGLKHTSKIETNENNGGICRDITYESSIFSYGLSIDSGITVQSQSNEQEIKKLEHEDWEHLGTNESYADDDGFGDEDVVLKAQTHGYSHIEGVPIIRVNSLAADETDPAYQQGDITFSQAILTPGERIIVFEVGGIIDLRNSSHYNPQPDVENRMRFLHVLEPNCVVAGETAPYPGITVIGTGVRVRASHVLFRHIRIRPGYHKSIRLMITNAFAVNANGYESNTDPQLPPSSESLNLENIMTDHCSLSWSSDQNCSTYPGNGAGPSELVGTVRNVTFKDTIISEPIGNTGAPQAPEFPNHPNQRDHFNGCLVSNSGSDRILFYRCLFTHCNKRAPFQISGGLVDEAPQSAMVINNIIVNPRRQAIQAGGGGTVGPTVTMLNNVIIPGPNTQQYRKGRLPGSLGAGDTRFTSPFYVQGGINTAVEGVNVYLEDNRLVNNGHLDDGGTLNGQDGLDYDVIIDGRRTSPPYNGLEAVSGSPNSFVDEYNGWVSYDDLPERMSSSQLYNTFEAGDFKTGPRHGIKNYSNYAEDTGEITTVYEDNAVDDRQGRYREAGWLGTPQEQNPVPRHHFLPQQNESPSISGGYPDLPARTRTLTDSLLEEILLPIPRGPAGVLFVGTSGVPDPPPPPPPPPSGVDYLTLSPLASNQDATEHNHPDSNRGMVRIELDEHTFGNRASVEQLHVGVYFPIPVDKIYKFGKDVVSAKLSFRGTSLSSTEQYGDFDGKFYSESKIRPITYSHVDENISTNPDVPSRIASRDKSIIGDDGSSDAFGEWNDTEFHEVDVINSVKSYSDLERLSKFAVIVGTSGGGVNHPGLAVLWDTKPRPPLPPYGIVETEIDESKFVLEDDGYSHVRSDYSKDSKLYATVIYDTVRVFDLKTTEVIFIESVTVGGSTIAGSSVAISEDGELVAAIFGRELIVWKIETGVIQWQKENSFYSFEKLSFDPNSSLLAYGMKTQSGSSAEIASVDDGSVLYSTPLTEVKITEIKFSPTDKKVLVATGDGFIRIFDLLDVGNVSLFLEFDGHVPTVTSGTNTSANFSNDGRFVVSTSSRPRLPGDPSFPLVGVVKIWKVADGSEKLSIDNPGHLPSEAVFSPDDQYFAVAWAENWGSGVGVTKVRDLSGREIVKFGTPGNCTSVQFIDFPIVEENLGDWEGVVDSFSDLNGFTRVERVYRYDEDLLESVQIYKFYFDDKEPAFLVWYTEGPDSVNIDLSFLLEGDKVTSINNVGGTQNTVDASSDDITFVKDFANLLKVGPKAVNILWDNLNPATDDGRRIAWSYDGAQDVDEPAFAPHLIIGFALQENFSFVSDGRFSTLIAGITINGGSDSATQGFANYSFMSSGNYDDTIDPVTGGPLIAGITIGGNAAAGFTLPPEPVGISTSALTLAGGDPQGVQNKRVENILVKRCLFAHHHDLINLETGTSSHKNKALVVNSLMYNPVKNSMLSSTDDAGGPAADISSLQFTAIGNFIKTGLDTEVWEHINVNGPYATDEGFTGTMRVGDFDANTGLPEVYLDDNVISPHDDYDHPSAAGSDKSRAVDLNASSDGQITGVFVSSHMSWIPLSDLDIIDSSQVQTTILDLVGARQQILNYSDYENDSGSIVTLNESNPIDDVLRSQVSNTTGQITSYQGGVTQTTAEDTSLSYDQRGYPDLTARNRNFVLETLLEIPDGFIPSYDTASDPAVFQWLDHVHADELSIGSGKGKTVETITNDTFSWSIWFNRAAGTNDKERYLVKKDNEFGISLFFTSSVKVLLHFSGVDPGLELLAPETDILEGRWHHLVVTFDKDSVGFYLNGILVISTTSVATTDFATSNSSLLFGNHGDDENADYFHGLMDSVSYWKRILTSQEVSNLYNSGVGIDYPFDFSNSTPAHLGDGGSVINGDVLSDSKLIYGPDVSGSIIGSGFADVEYVNFLELCITGIDEHPIVLGSLFEFSYSPVNVIASGGSLLDGEAYITGNNYIAYITGEELILTAPEVVTGAVYNYMPTGSEITLGSLTIMERIFDFVSTGEEIILGSLSEIVSSSYSYYPEDTVILLEGLSGARSSVVISEVVSIGLATSVTDLEFRFSGKGVDSTLVPAVSEIAQKCGCTELPLIVDFSQNITFNNILANFLARNNLSVSRNLRMNYNKGNDSWQSNLFFEGPSLDDKNDERWNILFDLKCTNNLGGTSCGECRFWRFSYQITRNIVTTGEDFITKLVLAFLPESICADEDLEFELDYNTNSNVVTIKPDTVIYQKVFVDEIGLFKNEYWKNNPHVKIKLSELVLENPNPRKNFDIVLDQLEDPLSGLTANFNVEKFKSATTDQSKIPDFSAGPTGMRLVKNEDGSVTIELGTGPEFPEEIGDLVFSSQDGVLEVQ